MTSECSRRADTRHSTLTVACQCDTVEMNLCGNAGIMDQYTWGKTDGLNVERMDIFLALQSAHVSVP